MKKRSLVFEKEIYVGRDRDGSRVYIEVNITEESGREWQTIDHKVVSTYLRLSISGQAIPWSSGGDFTYCGQIQSTIMGQVEDETFQCSILSSKLIRILDIWNRWHLNDLIPGCVHQKTGSYDDPAISGQICPDTGYKYGHAWLVEPLPGPIVDEVISW